MKFSAVLVTVFAGAAMAAPSEYKPEYKDEVAPVKEALPIHDPEYNEHVAPVPVYDPKYPEDIIPEYDPEDVDEAAPIDYTLPDHDVIHYRRDGSDMAKRYGGDDHQSDYPKGGPKPGYPGGGNGNGGGDNGNGGGDGDNGNGGGDGDNGNGGGDGDNGNGGGDGDNGNGGGDGGETPAPYEACPDMGLLAAVGPRCCASGLLNLVYFDCVLADPTSPENFEAVCGARKSPVCCPVNLGRVASLLCQTPIGL
ncbi:hypothetical protein F5X68DRAFT_266174 [Plectosphaerella plurivora]|uniref:Uncharacterized protein n=1 Tax=Plectosphaerella plurivora TaxID=936078 RepID=A0A9P8V0B6_9PEZI|nr:hypothetical protein F5X68DRAFT_266174 [Plectosphaerella plurivora]